MKREALKGRLERAAKQGYRIEAKSERATHGRVTRWRPAAVIHVERGEVVLTQPIASGSKELTFVTREQADQHITEVALAWIQSKHIGSRL